MEINIQKRIPTRQIQTTKRNIPLEQIIAIHGYNPLAEGIETTGNVLGQAILKRAELRKQGEDLARKDQKELELLALKHQYDMELQSGKEQPEESYTIAGTDKQGNIIQIGNKSGKPRVIPMPGGGTLFPKNETPLTTENAGKLTMLQLATKDIDDVESMILKDGVPDYKMIAASNVPFGGLPFSKGRDVNSLIENSVAAKLRAETGATANESEVKSISRRFKPTIRDNPDTIKNKLGRLREFMTTAVATADPRGTRLRTIEPRRPTAITPSKVGRFQIEVEE